MVHPGKKDWWLAGLLAVISSGQLVGGGTLIGMAIQQRVRPADPGSDAARGRQPDPVVPHRHEV